MDGETSLGKKFDTWIAKKGIDIEQSPLHTLDQNGVAERSRGVLIARATALRTSANLLEFLWPDIYIATGYLINQTPNRTLQVTTT